MKPFHDGFWVVFVTSQVCGVFTAGPFSRFDAGLCLGFE